MRSSTVTDNASARVKRQRLRAASQIDAERHRARSRRAARHAAQRERQTRARRGLIRSLDGEGIGVGLSRARAFGPQPRPLSARARALTCARSLTSLLTPRSRAGRRPCARSGRGGTCPRPSPPDGRTSPASPRARCRRPWPTMAGVAGSPRRCPRCAGRAAVDCRRS